MKSKRSKIVIVTLFSIIIAIAISLPYLRKTSPLFNMFFTPKDWSVPLVQQNVEFGSQGKTYTLPFEVKYPGLHWANISVAKSPTDQMYSGNFELFLEVKEGNDLLDSKTFKPPAATFEGNIGGFPIYWFRSPDNLPIRKKINLNLKILKADPKFKELHGQATLTIRKLADL